MESPGSKVSAKGEATYSGSAFVILVRKRVSHPIFRITKESEVVVKLMMVSMVKHDTGTSNWGLPDTVKDTGILSSGF